MRSPVELDDVGYLDVPASAVQIGERGARRRRCACWTPGCSPRAPRSRRSSPSSPLTSSGRPCVAVNSGTSALLLALLALGHRARRRGDRPVVQLRGHRERGRAHRRHGRCSPTSSPTTSASIPPPSRRRSTTRTAAIMPVHLYGHPARDGPHRATSRRRTGSPSSRTPPRPTSPRSTGARSAPSGAVAAFSFYPTKNMTAGRAGWSSAPTRPSPARVRLLRNQGMERRYANEIVGYNMRMTDLHAAIGRVQLVALPDWTAQRGATPRSSAARWQARGRGGAAAVAAAPRRCGTSTPSGRPIATRWRAAWPTGGSGTGVYYPTPIHRLPAYALELDLPVTERAAAEVLSLPVHPALSRGRSSSTSSRPSTWAVSAMTRTLRAGLIGLGRMGRHHARVLRDAARRRPGGRRRHPATRYPSRGGRSTWSTRVDGPPRPGHRPLRGGHPHRDARGRSPRSWPRPASPR